MCVQGIARIGFGDLYFINFIKSYTTFLGLMRDTLYMIMILDSPEPNYRNIIMPCVFVIGDCIM